MASTTSSDDSVEITKDELVHTISKNNAEVHPEKELTFARFCWDKAFCKCFFPFFVVVAVIVGTTTALGIQPSRDEIPQTLADFIFSRDGWEGLEARDLPRWNTRGAGLLRLEMLNALEDHWQPYFEQSIEEWNNGEPRVVELTVTKVEPDSGCDFIRGKFAVCAGDYGDTTFHGVNEILVNGDSITASVAKLNEYYLARVTATEARKQYTMCHEIGHGLGLPHSDENFYNLNLGNCMDYTDRPWSNTAPDATTFALLNEIYGNPSRPDGEDGGTVVSSSSTNSMGNLRGGDEPDSIPESIRQRANDAAQNLESKFANNDSDDDWVQLHRDNNTAAFQIELGDGFFLQAHFLLVKDEDKS